MVVRLMHMNQTPRSNANATPSEPRLAAIPRKSAKDAVVDEIRSSISRGILKAGDRVIEQKLAGSLNVSQSTVREALVDLEHLGFVYRVPPRKTFITRLTRRDIDELYAVRVPLEKLAVELLAKRNPLNLADAERACEEMRRAAVAEDRGRFEDADLDFHRAIWAATGNRTLAGILEKVVVKLFAFGFVMNKHIQASRSQMGKQMEQHANILGLIRKRDFRGAKSLMAASMDRTWLDDIEFPEDPRNFEAGERKTPAGR